LAGDDAGQSSEGLKEATDELKTVLDPLMDAFNGVKSLAGKVGVSL
jgi:hypothetical protein